MIHEGEPNGLEEVERFAADLIREYRFAPLEELVKNQPELMDPNEPGRLYAEARGLVMSGRVDGARPDLEKLVALGEKYVGKVLVESDLKLLERKNVVKAIGHFAMTANLLGMINWMSVGHGDSGDSGLAGVVVTIEKGISWSRKLGISGILVKGLANKGIVNRTRALRSPTWEARRILAEEILAFSEIARISVQTSPSELDATFWPYYYNSLGVLYMDMGALPKSDSTNGLTGEHLEYVLKAREFFRVALDGASAMNHHGLKYKTPEGMALSNKAHSYLVEAEYRLRLGGMESDQLAELLTEFSSNFEKAVGVLELFPEKLWVDFLPEILRRRAESLLLLAKVRLSETPLNESYFVEEARTFGMASGGGAIVGAEGGGFIVLSMFLNQAERLISEAQGVSVEPDDLKLLERTMADLYRVRAIAEISGEGDGQNDEASVV